jgi:hypothetical protein
MTSTVTLKTGRSEPARVVSPGDFEPELHYYPRVLNATLHPAVAFFMNLGYRRFMTRYCHLNPRVDPERLEQVLSYRPTYFQWAGADLFHVTTAAGNRQMVVIETNSCPSGHKSMPQPSDIDEQGGYRVLVERAFLPMVAGRRLPKGGLAVLFDKNEMEAEGYAAALADATGEPVNLAAFHDGDDDPAARFTDGVLEVRTADGAWLPMRAAFRYVTQRPWNRIPVSTRTALFNPVVACLAGGRNKMLAAKAYDLFNAELEGSGLQIRTPETIWNVSHHEIPLWVKRLGGLAVIKVPYSNAGQGVYTITSQEELDRFMEIEQHYGQFIVQSLLGNYHWSSGSRRRRLYHVGTVPNKKKQIFVADLRVMIGASPEGFRPLAIYGRRARSPLSDRLEPGVSSWEMLGTNLSRRREDGGWEADTGRLMMMDRKDFNVLGLGFDDLLEAFIQTVLAVIAIDRFCAELFTRKGKFRMKLFRSLENDPALVDEVLL